MDHDPVNHPKGYTSHPSGVECITITRHMNFNLGNAIKYLWRHGHKPGVDEIEDLKKARWYIDDEIKRLQSRLAGEPKVGCEVAPRHWSHDPRDR